jgi:hypothetical protein
MEADVSASGFSRFTAPGAAVSHVVYGVIDAL